MDRAAHGARFCPRFIAADTDGKIAVKLYHKLNVGLLAATPAALVLDYSVLSTPVDIGLAITFPLHGHIGMNYVMTDYVPKMLGKSALAPARAARSPRLSKEGILPRARL